MNIDISKITRSVLLVSCVLLASCRLVIVSDETGRIFTASGRYDCDNAECAFEIKRKITDRFIAVPAEGYRFVRWGGICTSTPIYICDASVEPLAEEYQQYDGDIGLWAEFEPVSTRRAWYLDEDGDHFGTPTQRKVSRVRPRNHVINNLDCDDGDASIRPYVKELEDGRDNNCNGKIDEGFVDIEFFEDSDGDGFGNPEVSRVERQKPAGFVRNALDCDDTDARVNPEADELADNRDNDCDGSVDEDANRYFRDVDGDGFGGQSDTVEAIEPVDGYVDNAEDCDDNNATISPAAEETFDSIDNDCDGVIDEGFTPREYFRDIDGDGYGDREEFVVEVEAPDGYVRNSTDNCVEIYNPSQSDLDEDGIGDACDEFTDSDSDDIQDSADNCPLTYNPGQSDQDEDGRGDACDEVDDRGDGGEGDPCAMSAEDHAMLEAVNAFRAEAQECGSTAYAAVAPLTWNCQLKTAALDHSMDMANQNFFSHTGSDGSSAGDRISRSGYSWSAWGENVAAGYNSVNSVMQGWINSPGHCANLMNPNVSNLGAARYSNASSTYGVYWTQVFARPR